MSNKISYILAPIFLALSLAIGVFLGQRLGPQKANYHSENINAGSKFDAIMQLIQDRYVDTINREKFVDQSINDFLHELDPHSNYFSPKALAEMMEGIDGKFGGVGVRFLIHNDTLSVTNVIKDSPSYRSGIIAGDRIVAVNGKSISGKKLTNEQVMEMLKGEPGTEVTVSIFRKGEITKHKIVRGVIPIESISCATMLNKNIGYVRLEQFSQTSSEEFHNATMKLKQQGMKKLIFDLRDNGGGVLSSAIEIVDEFLPQGKLIVYTKGAHQPKKTYISTDRGNLEDVELLLLINSNSASASEIVAGAIQDNDRGTIMGRRSFGKGLVQEDIPLRDGSNVRLTIARYYTPTGRCIQKPYGEGIDYQEDFMNRYQNGELYHVDSTTFVDSLKFKTPKGKIVYGGGGIMPDIFIPFDSSGSSYYLSELRYSMSFSHFAFDFANKVGRTKWQNEQDYRKNFQVSTQLLNDFINYSATKYKVKKNEPEFLQSKALITEFLKAEIARQIWVEQGYLTVMLDFDKDVKAAVNYLQK
ncbi:MAG: S41 family peptidase [Crocinitomicaceae bacterium]